ncbi:MAG: hypothetical protein SP4CHLAM5_06610 [Chlamydiia bacterium]|nr:hypothetical protein [Chlamydiia bacterium]MCH9618529.1 hypothetical protein [Chlamydiia bacterium]MCH9624815.1 hypothetical protein [Chlamydiia bacterium]
MTRVIYISTLKSVQTNWVSHEVLIGGTVHVRKFNTTIIDIGKYDSTIVKINQCLHEDKIFCRGVKICVHTVSGEPYEGLFFSCTLPEGSTLPSNCALYMLKLLDIY